MKIILLILLPLLLALHAIDVSATTPPPRLKVVRKIKPTFASKVAPGDNCLDMSTGFACNQPAQVIEAVNAGPAAGNTSGDKPPVPGRLRYIVSPDHGAMTVFSCITDPQRWLYLFYVMEWQAPPAVLSAGKGAGAAALMTKSVRTVKGSGTPPVPAGMPAPAPKP